MPARVLQQLDSTGELLRAVGAEVDALEALCAGIERAMMAGRWEELGAALAESRRVQHALENAMHDAQSARTEGFDAEISQRLRRVFTIRENQMARLLQYRNAVGERLAAIARLKTVARRIGTAHAAPRLGALDELS